MISERQKTTIILSDYSGGKITLEVIALEAIEKTLPGASKYSIIC